MTECDCGRVEYETPTARERAEAQLRDKPLSGIEHINNECSRRVKKREDFFYGVLSATFFLPAIDSIVYHMGEMINNIGLTEFADDLFPKLFLAGAGATLASWIYNHTGSRREEIYLRDASDNILRREYGWMEDDD